MIYHGINSKPSTLPFYAFFPAVLLRFSCKSPVLCDENIESAASCTILTWVAVVARLKLRKCLQEWNHDLTF